MDVTKAPAPGRQHQGAGDVRKHNNSSTGYPICKVYSCPIVDCFPRGCLLASADPLEAFREVKERYWLHLHPEDPASSECLYQRSRYDDCWACVGENLTHPNIRRLRRLQRTARPSSPPTTADTSSRRNGKQQKRLARRHPYV